MSLGCGVAGLYARVSQVSHLMSTSLADNRYLGVEVSLYTYKSSFVPISTNFCGLLFRSSQYYQK